MTQLPVADSSVERALDDLFEAIRAAASLVVTAVAWVGFVAIAVGWLVFWSALARVHVMHGDMLPAALSVGAIAVPVMLLWYVRRRDA